MKNVFATSLFFILQPVLGMLYAQQAETLFTGDVRHAGFGSLTFGITSVNGEASYLRGSRGAWVINFENGNTLNIGLGGYRTQTGFRAINGIVNGRQFPEMKTNYGGFELEYLKNVNKLVHTGIQILIGGGNVRFRDNDIDLDKKTDSYFVIQPGINTHVNLTNWFRISGGIFYRQAMGVDIEGTDDKGLSGLSAVIGLRFGKF